MCIDGEQDVFLEGTKESMVLKQDHAYFFYEIYRCSWRTQFVGDPPCAVDTYMRSKLDPSKPLIVKSEIPDGEL